MYEIWKRLCINRFDQRLCRGDGGTGNVKSLKEGKVGFSGVNNG